MSDNTALLTEEQIVRAFRDEEYRKTLTFEQFMYADANGPEDKIELELTDEALEAVSGGKAAAISSLCSLCTACSWCDWF